MAIERWPPIYDAQDLKNAIEQLSALPGGSLYGVLNEGGPCCQGDVLQLQAGVPVIDTDGTAQVVEDFSYWLVIGNTCDFERAGVEWTQIVPLTELIDPPTIQEHRDLTRYQLSRRFYLPAWTGVTNGYVADLLRPVALRKTAVGGAAQVAARMSHAGWILLHSCLVRFLARDDGRFDA